MPNNRSAAPRRPSGAGNETAERERLVRLLASPQAFARLDGVRAVVFARPGQVTLRTGSAAGALLAELESAGAVAGVRGRQGVEYRLTEAGQAWLRRHNQAGVAGQEDRFSRQHQILVEQPGAGPDRETVTVNEAENLLLWLYRRKSKSGSSLIGDAEFAAGERLRADLTRSCILPRLTADWERASMSKGTSSGLTPTESMMAAKQRVDRALSGVGPEFSGLLLDVCGFSKSIELIERERSWPARSAKVVLVLALQRLARHYGLSNEARGRAHSGVLASWGSPDFRPDFTAEPPPVSANHTAGIAPDSFDHGSQPV